MAPSETKMLFIRHGQSTWNEAGRWQGRADPPLSEFGEQQAHTAAKVIGQVDAIISSPLERALGTAAIIGTHIGVGPIQILDDLMERDSGEWLGARRGVACPLAQRNRRYRHRVCRGDVVGIEPWWRDHQA